MKLGRSVLVGVAMVALAVASGCKSSSDQGSSPAGDGTSPGQPGVQAPGDTAAPANGPEDPSARRGRRHRGPGNGEWHRKRRAAAGDPGSDTGAPQPAVPPQQ